MCVTEVYALFFKKFFRLSMEYYGYDLHPLFVWSRSSSAFCYVWLMQYCCNHATATYIWKNLQWLSVQCLYFVVYTNFFPFKHFWICIAHEINCYDCHEVKWVIIVCNWGPRLILGKTPKIIMKWINMIMIYTLYF